MKSNKEKRQAVVIGSGIIGCAIAQQLTLENIDCIILEREPRIAEGVTSRNSGVIHAGIYYPPQSIKAEMCLEGRALLVQWCEETGVPYKITGKWVVGSFSNLETLENTLANATKSGAFGIGPVERIKLEGISATHGFYSALSGIVDPIQFSKSLQIRSIERGATWVTGTEVLSVNRQSSQNYLVETTKGAIETELVINCAGLYADQIAKMDGLDGYQIYPWRGDYFKLRSSVNWKNLIYPVKEKNDPGLGVHITLGLDGSVRLGPDVSYQENREDFSPPNNLEEKTGSFLNAARKYISNITAADLSYDTCGLRPKLRAPSDSKERDFVVTLGSSGFLHFIGIESPGLTAALALAKSGAKLLLH